MIKISQVISKIISENPLYSKAISQEIINYSALARLIKPQVEKTLMEAVSTGALTISIKRFANDFKRSHRAITKNFTVSNISLRSGLNIFIFKNSPRLEQIHQELLSLKDKTNDSYLHFAQGSQESSFIVNNLLSKSLVNSSKKEMLLAKYHKLTSISVRMPIEAMEEPGVFAPFVETLSWKNICIYQLISLFTEVTFVISDKDADMALNAIQRYIQDKNKKVAGF